MLVLVFQGGTDPRRAGSERGPSEGGAWRQGTSGCCGRTGNLNR